MEAGGQAAGLLVDMNRYTLTKKLGDGTYGSVVKAVNRQTGEEVAVKKMKKLFTRQVSQSFPQDCCCYAAIGRRDCK